MSEPQPLQEGDLVRLRAGSPPMSLQTISEDGRDGTCLWFDSGGVLHEQTFRLVSLRKFEEEEPGAT